MLALVVVVVIIAAVAGSSSKDSTPTSASSGPASDDTRVALAAGASGTVKTAGDAIVTVTLNNILDPATSTNQFSKPGAGNRFIAYEVTVENTGTKESNAGSAKLRTTDGFEFDRKFTAGIGDSVDVYQRLTSGGKVKGFLVFEIPEAAKVQWLRFDPNPFAKGDLYFDGTAQ